MISSIPIFPQWLCKAFHNVFLLVGEFIWNVWSASYSRTNSLTVLSRVFWTHHADHISFCHCIRFWDLGSWSPMILFPWLIEPCGQTTVHDKVGLGMPQNQCSGLGQIQYRDGHHRAEQRPLWDTLRSVQNFRSRRHGTRYKRHWRASIFQHQPQHQSSHSHKNKNLTHTFLKIKTNIIHNRQPRCFNQLLYLA